MASPRAQTTKQILRMNQNAFGENKAFKYEILASNPELDIEVSLYDIFVGQYESKLGQSVKAGLDMLKDDDDIDKSQLHASLLRKYFAEGLVADYDINDIMQPNAYNSLPSQLNAAGGFEESPDSLLHQLFLFPYKAYCVSYEHHHWQVENEITPREWHLNPTNETVCNIAELLRTQIQILILSDIQNDYHNNENPYYNKEIDSQLPSIHRLKKSLLKNNQASLAAVSDFASTAYDKHQIGVPEHWQRGLLGNDNKQRLLAYANDFKSYFLQHFAGFRVLLGQPSTDLKHAEALRWRTHDNAIIRKIQYAIGLIIAHLNIGTIKFGLYWMAKSWINLFKDLKGLITDRFTVIKLSISLAKLTATILGTVLLPLLFILPPLLGITSLPFTLIRACLPRTVNFFNEDAPNRSYRAFQKLDVIEFIKDTVVTLAALNFASNLLTGLGIFVFIPNPILTIPLLFFVNLSVGLILEGQIFKGLITGATAGLFGIQPLASLLELSKTALARITASILIGALVAFTAIAAIGRFVGPILPRPIKNLFGKLDRFIEWLDKKYDEIYYGQNPDKHQPVGAMVAEPIILNQNQISAQTHHIATTIQRRLGQLNQSANLCAERKALIQQAINNLEINANSTEESLQEAVRAAGQLCNGNFTRDEASIIQDLAVLLEGISHAENNAIRLKIGVNLNQEDVHFYQPSWALIQQLENRRLIQDNAWSNEAKEMGCDDRMLSKINLIRNLRGQ